MLLRIDSCGECPFRINHKPEDYWTCSEDFILENFPQLPDCCPLREREFDCEKECPAFGVGMAHGVFPHTDDCPCHDCQESDHV